MTIKGIDLAADESPARRRQAMVAALFFGLVGLGFIFGPLLAAASFSDFVDYARSISGPDALPDDTMSPLIALPIGVGLLLVGQSVVLMLRMTRSAAWLDGTVAYVRGALRTRSIDLSTAYVSASSETRHEQVGQTHTAAGTVQHIAVSEVPVLEARDPASGKKLTIQLHRPGGGTIPPYALRALADAMVHGRGWHGNDRDVQELAQRLRRVAGGDRPLDDSHATTRPDPGSYGTTTGPWPPVGSGGPGGFGPGAVDPRSASALHGTPTPVRRQANIGLTVMVALLGVLLLGGLGTAVALYGSRLISGGEKAPADAGAATALNPAAGGPTGTVDGGATAKPEPKKPGTLAAGKSAEVNVDGGVVRIRVDKIVRHKSYCGSLGFPPSNGGYITARVSYDVISGTPLITSDNFDFVGSDGTSYDSILAESTGCGGDGLSISDAKAGSKVSGYVAFDAAGRGVISFEGQAGAWRVG